MLLTAKCRALNVEIPQTKPLQIPESRNLKNDPLESQHDKQSITVGMKACEYMKTTNMGNAWF